MGSSKNKLMWCLFTFKMCRFTILQLIYELHNHTFQGLVESKGKCPHCIKTLLSIWDVIPNTFKGCIQDFN